jgi:hypothetical protein
MQERLENNMQPDMQPYDREQKDNRTDKYTEANDRTTLMSDLEYCMKKLEEKGYKHQFRVEGGRLVSMTDPKKKYKAVEVQAANFFRFEGITDPEDMSILYAIETTDGQKGTLVDAYGLYSDDETGDFMKEVEIHKKVTKGELQ